MAHYLSNEAVYSMLSDHLGVEEFYGTRPTLQPAVETRMHHNQMRILQEIFAAQSLIYVNPNTTYSSKNPLSELTLVQMTDLIIGIPAIGKYLLLRIIEPGYVMDTWRTVVEDHVGNVCDLSLYIYPEVELLSVGSVIILKEPYFQTMTNGTQSLRNDCPTDIIVLRKSSLTENIVWSNDIYEVADPLYTPPVPNTAKKWKARGKALYRDRQYYLASEAFALGLKLCEETDNVWRRLQLHLSTVLLVLGYYEKSIDSAERVLKLYPNNIKGLLRAGKCYYILREYKQALEKFEKAHYVDEHNDKAIVEMMKTEQRIIEQETDKVEIGKMELECLMSPMTKSERADYVGPVMVVDVCGKDRGMVATRDVVAGELLMISRAISSSFVQDENFHFQYDFKKSAIIPKNLMNVVAEVVQMVAKNPNTYGPLIYDLSDGCVPREKVQIFCDPETKEEPISDVGKIRDICLCNAFSISNIFNGKVEGCGLFILPSYMNHSCVPNADFAIYNDVMLVHAYERIKAGDEVCISYLPRELSAERIKELLKHKLQVCLCPRCRPAPMKSKSENTFS